MSRDDKASYYDLELPDGTTVEAQDVTRALLERAALPPYASKCLGTLLERVWRFGAKPDTDSARESEKVVTEATFLCEALGGVPSFTLRDVARAAHDAGIEIKFSCDDPAARIAELERERDSARMDFVQAHRERDEYRRLYEAEAAAGKALSETHTRATADYIAATDEADAERDRWRQTAERAQADLNALRTTLETERQAAVATAEELERVRAILAAAEAALPATVRSHSGLTLGGWVVDLSGRHAEAIEELERVRKELAEVVDERQLQRWRDMLQARPADTLTNAISRVTKELAALRDRYRPRRQSEEPAPRDETVLVCGCRGRVWTATRGAHIGETAFWCHQPPAPGEGE